MNLKGLLAGVIFGALGFAATASAATIDWAVWSSEIPPVPGGGAIVDSWCNNADSHAPSQCSPTSPVAIIDPGGTVTAFSLSSPISSADGLEWNFSFSLLSTQSPDAGTIYSASGIFVTQDTLTDGGFLITSLTGTINGAPMTLLAPDGSFNDNLLFTTQPELDEFGLGFTTLGSVPEPSTWALMFLGFAGLGFAGYRRTRKGTAARASA
jgi:hypothetical protein